MATNINGATISTTDTDETLDIVPNGAGAINLQDIAVVATSGTDDGITFYPSVPTVHASRNGGTIFFWRRRSSDGSITAFYRDTTAVGSISVTTTATAYNTSSAAAVKDQIIAADLGKFTNILKTVQVREFEFKAEPGIKRVGMVAEELALVVPEAVTLDENPLLHGIDYSKLVPHMLATIQGLVNRVETLEAQVAALIP